MGGHGRLCEVIGVMGGKEIIRMEDSSCRIDEAAYFCQFVAARGSGVRLLPRAAGLRKIFAAAARGSNLTSLPRAATKVGNGRLWEDMGGYVR